MSHTVFAFNCEAGGGAGLDRGLGRSEQGGVVFGFQSGQALSFSGAERVSDTNNDQHVYTNWFDKAQFVPQTAFTLRATSSRICSVRTSTYARTTSATRLTSTWLRASKNACVSAA